MKRTNYIRATKPYKDLTGITFGLLTVKRFLRMNEHKQSIWVCGCQCGKEITPRGNSLKTGNTTSCGCDRQTTATHGHTSGKRTPTYRSWQAMLTRCTNPKGIHFHHYGGRGITVCKRWRESFIAFLKDMGERPSGMTLDRINNDGNYTPANCQWATASQQQTNKRK